MASKASMSLYVDLTDASSPVLRKGSYAVLRSAAGLSTSVSLGNRVTLKT